MHRRMSRVVFVCAVAAGVVLAGGGVAMAVSGGGYQPSEQDCPANADSNSAGQKGQPPNPVPGCHNFQVNLQSDNGTRYGEAGLDQLPQGYPDFPGGFLFGIGQPGSPNFPHSGCAAFNTNGENGGPGVGCGTGTGTGGTLIFDLYDPAKTTFIPQTGAPDVQALAAAVQDGLNVYLGADDNLDAGEHDGVDSKYGTNKAVNGPSDGGAVTAHVSPSQATTAPSLSNPVPVAGASMGMCADNICAEGTTQRQTIYQGGDKSRTRDAANYEGKKWDPEACSSGSPQDEQQCDDPNTATTETMNDWRKAEAGNVYAEPGVQVYGDPDPQSSPIGPYPLPGQYVGTCGVVYTPVDGSPPPAGAPTNSAGQVVIPTGC